MRIGRLRHRIVIEQATETQDGSGFPAPSWATYATRWAAVEPMTGRERFEGAQFESAVDTKFTVRHDSLTAAITPKMRISYDSRYFEIDAVINPEERNRTLEILAEEIKS